MVLTVLDSVFLDTTSFDSARSLDQLPAFLKTFAPGDGSGLSESSEEKGTPHTLVISPAALRAAEVVRALRAFQHKDSIIGKLFAKHIKLEEAKQFLERARYVFPILSIFRALGCLANYVRPEPALALALRHGSLI